jgi:hypothetical protein
MPKVYGFGGIGTHDALNTMLSTALSPLGRLSRMRPVGGAAATAAARLGDERMTTVYRQACTRRLPGE